MKETEISEGNFYRTEEAALTKHRRLCPRAVTGEGLSVSAFDTNPKDAVRVTTPNRDVTSWLRKIGMAK